MSHKIALRTQREGTIINTTSSKQEKLLPTFEPNSLMLTLQPPRALLQ